MGQEGQEQQEQEKPGGAGGGENQQQPAPFDPEALRTVMTDVMREEFQRRAEENAGQDRGREEQQQQPPEPTPLEKVIAPIVGPALRQINLNTQGATDAAIFYSTDSDDAALRRKWRGEVEAQFNELARQGRMTPREDIFNWMIGGKKRTEYLDWAIKERESKARAAEMATDAGGGSSRMAGAGKKPPAEMTEKEMEDALKDGF